ncbi:MgtC/SapB family protein [Virgibacillus kekensis]|uniref:MgtC/SapB family protein n=1 Tax=Virgibacillus kekensis TaxID=202261 RepID=A0ABV9DLE9_9BACI
MIEYIDQVFGENFSIIMLRVLVALVLSGLIGFEREIKNHSAGFRTHIIVGVGSCLMMLLSLYGFEELINEYDNIRFDPARIPSYVISGIGFLGAGTIIVNGMTIRGLTTAASIWTTAGLGLVVGAGMYAPAVFTTLIILLSLVFLNNFEEKLTKGRSSYLIEIVALPGLKINSIVSVLEKHEVIIKDVEIERAEGDNRNIYIKLDRNSEFDRVALFAEIARVDQVKNIVERN